MKRFVLCILISLAGTFAITGNAKAQILYVGADGYYGTSPSTIKILPNGTQSSYLNGYDPLGINSTGDLFYISEGNIYEYSSQGQTSFLTSGTGSFANDFQGGSYFNLSGSFYKLNTSGGLTQLFTSNYQGAIAYHPNGYFVGIQNNNLIKIDMTGGVHAINLNANYGFSQSQLTVDSFGNIYYDKPGSGEVYKIGPNMNPVGINSGNFIFPYGMAADANGNIYITDWYYQNVVKIDARGNQSIFAANLNYPSSIVLSPISVPEPSTYVLFGLGAIVMLMVIRRKKTT